MDKDFAYIANEFPEKFEAEIIEQMDEKNFLSISARSNFFNKTLDNGMNIQMSLRNSSDENRTILTIGTPIITEEY